VNMMAAVPSINSATSSVEENDGFVFYTSVAPPIDSKAEEGCWDEGFCFMMSSSSSTPVVSHALDWIIDTGATHCLCNNYSFMQNIVPTQIQIATGHSNTSLLINKCGSIVFKPVEDNFCKITLTEVFFSEHAVANIISLHSFINTGCNVTISGEKLFVMWNTNFLCFL
jgi:hypothetical protein